MKKNCPVCNTTIIKKDNSFWPFCSKRCRLLDLGDWLSEQHYVAGEETQVLDIINNSDADNSY